MLGYVIWKARPVPLKQFDYKHDLLALDVGIFASGGFLT